MSRYHSQGFSVDVQPDTADGGFFATVIGLPGIVGQGETQREAFDDCWRALQSAMSAWWAYVPPRPRL